MINTQQGTQQIQKEKLGPVINQYENRLFQYRSYKSFQATTSSVIRYLTFPIVHTMSVKLPTLPVTVNFNDQVSQMYSILTFCPEIKMFLLSPTLFLVVYKFAYDNIPFLHETSPTFGSNLQTFRINFLYASFHCCKLLHQIRIMNIKLVENITK